MPSSPCPSCNHPCAESDPKCKNCGRSRENDPDYIYWLKYEMIEPGKDTELRKRIGCFLAVALLMALGFFCCVSRPSVEDEYQKTLQWEKEQRDKQDAERERENRRELQRQLERNLNRR